MKRERPLCIVFLGFSCGSAGKTSACSLPWVGKIPGEGKGYPLQYSGLEGHGFNPWLGNMLCSAARKKKKLHMDFWLHKGQHPKLLHCSRSDVLLYWWLPNVELQPELLSRALGSFTSNEPLHIFPWVSGKISNVMCPEPNYTHSHTICSSSSYQLHLD